MLIDCCAHLVTHAAIPIHDAKVEKIEMAVKRYVPHYWECVELRIFWGNLRKPAGRLPGRYPPKPFTSLFYPPFYPVAGTNV